ncbi:hypothetical protein FJZ36_11450, partial [Candidatus Poribacteria bacterium]|nr:hypothetical protein [Candidatus Poribacteria bacterium]
MHRAWHRVAFRFLLALIAIAPAAWLHAAVGDVTTFAGGGGSSAEGATALTAAMNGPHGLYVAPNGDVYYTEEYGHKVRKISGGIVTTVAGTGVEGGAGDGGPATAAQLSYPVGVWGDGVGNLYISEHYASAISGGRVRKIGPAGIISTLAGGGATSPSDTPIPGPSAALSSLGDLVVAPNGNIFVAVYGTSQLVRIDPSGNIVLRASGTGGLGISSSPTGLIYIAGTHPGSPSPGHRVYTWDDATATLTAIAGTGTNAFSGDGGPPLAANMMPQDTVLSGDGTLFIGDRFNGRVRKIAGGIINTQAIITDPKGMAALGADLLVVSPSTIVRIEGVIAPFAPPAPAFTSIVPNNGVRGTSVPVTINGSTLGGVTNLRLHRSVPSPADLNFPVTVPTATALTTTFDLATLGPDWDGLQGVHFSTNGGSTYASTGLTFMINSPPPPPAPAFTSIVPNNGVRGTSVPVTINGSTLGGVTNLRLHRTAPSPADLNFPVTVPTATVLTTTFDLTALGPDWDGLQEVHFSTNGGSTYASAGLTFMINSPPPPAPAFTSIVPNNGVRGTSVPVTINGSTLGGVTNLRLHRSVPSPADLNFPVTVPTATVLTTTFDLTALGPDWDGLQEVHFSTN